MFSFFQKFKAIKFSLFALYLISTNSVSATQESRITVSFLEDANYIYAPDKIDFSKFKKSSNNSLNFGFLRGAVWVLIKIKDPTKGDVLVFKNASLDILSFYLKDSVSFRLDSKLGDCFPFSKRTINHRFSHYRINGNNTVLVKIENFGDQFFVPIALKDERNFNENSYSEYVFFGIYYGLCLFAILLNLFLFYRIREISNLYYSIYVIGLVFLQLALNGHGFQYIWGDSVYFANHSLPFSGSFAVLFLLFFIWHFLDVKLNAPRSRTFIKICIIILGVNCILSLLPQTYVISILVINAASIIINLSIFPIGIIALRNNFKSARVFLAAFLLFIIFIFIFLLRNFGVLPSNTFTDYSLLIGSTAEVILLSYAIVEKFNSYKEDALNRLRDINEIQSQQNVKLEQEVTLRTERITEQKNQLQQKNNEIIDSINYAKRIQNALIPSKNEVQELIPQSLIIWKPKDIVSGDFYWVSKVATTSENQLNSEMILCCLGDCTGHGVPGAILSVLGLKILNLSLKNPKINTTSQALSYLHDEFSRTFTSNKENTIRDGMDIGFCAMDFRDMKLYFSGAKNGVYIIRNSELIELKGDRFSIGSEENSLVFKQYEFDLLKNDLVVLYSDGYADQFGGPKNKKFKYQTLKDLLVSYSDSSMGELEQQLDLSFEEWKGNGEQTDDVCILGFRV